MNPHVWQLDQRPCCIQCNISGNVRMRWQHGFLSRGIFHLMQVSHRSNILHDLGDKINRCCRMTYILYKGYPYSTSLRFCPITFNWGIFWLWFLIRCCYISSSFVIPISSKYYDGINLLEAHYQSIHFPTYYVAC